MIAFDSNVFIYVLNGDVVFGPKAATLLKATNESKGASELVFAEILASPKLQDDALHNKARAFLAALDIEWQMVSREVLFEAARLRRHQPKLKLVDALHLASAVVAGAQVFVTNDKDLWRLEDVGVTIKPLHFDIASDDSTSRG